MVYDIFNFLTGYVYIKLEGGRLERILNSGITFWNTSRHGYSCIYTNVSLVGYKQLLRLDGISITLIGESGLPALLKKLWSNKVLFFGFAISLFLVFVMSNMVFGIEVSGHYSLKEEEVKRYIYEWGLKPFMFKGKIDLDELCDYLRKKENIAWVSAGYNGVILNVEIIEQVNEFDNTPSDITASRQAIIKKIDVYSGVRNKEIGDVVNEGDLLVAGVQQGQAGVERIKARAKIVGTVWEKDSYTIDVAGLNISDTGNWVEEKYIDFWGNKSYISKAENGYEHYVVTEEKKSIGGRSGVLPVKYVTRRYNEVTISYDGGDINAITQKAEKMAFDKATLKVPENGQIISVTTDYEMNEGCITANVLLEIEMDIGNEVKIP